MTCKTEERFTQEEARAIHYLSAHTAASLRETLQNTLLTPHLSAVISKPDSGLDVMVNSDRSDDLSRLYRLFITVPEGLKTLKEAWKASILRRGMDINQSSELIAANAEKETSVNSEDRKGKGKARVSSTNAEVASNWVESVLTLKDLFDKYWKECLDTNREIETASNEVSSTVFLFTGTSKQAYDL